MGLRSFMIIIVASTQAGIDASISKFGPVRGVVNCAGVATPSRVVSAKGVPHRLDQFKTVRSHFPSIHPI